MTETAMIQFSILLPLEQVPRAVAMVDSLRAQGLEVTAALTRDDEEVTVCPLCGRQLAHLEDLHRHG